MLNLVREAIQNNDCNKLKQLLDKDPKAIEGKDKDGVKLAFYAALSGNIEIMRFIVEYSMASFNETDPWGNTVLHYGVQSKRLEMVIYLTERVGLSWAQGNKKLVTPFDLASKLHLTEIEAYFEKKCGASRKEMYHNPILTGMHPDPSIVRVGEDYYMVHSSFHYFPAIPISHSTDLIHWKVVGHAITRADWAGLTNLEGGRGYWAPDISYYKGRFYIAATYRCNDDNETKRMQMVTSSQYPEGPYEKPTFLKEDGIDPSIFTNFDDRRYMLLNRGARIFEISEDGKKIISKPQLLWYGDQKRAPEGPHMLWKDGYYYLFVAEGGTGRGHRISVARSKQLMGPYESCPYNPILRQWDEEGVIQCCGHGKPVKTQKGEWFMVYLCNRMIDGKYGMLGRETCLDPITWTSDGWPLVNQLKGPSILQKKPNIDVLVGENENEVRGQLEFPSENHWGEWKTARAMEEGRFGTDSNGFWFKGDGLDFNSINASGLLVVNQPDFTFTFSCIVEIEKLEEGESAGLICYYDENSYIKFGMGVEGGEKGILLQEYVDDKYIARKFIEGEFPFAEKIQLKIEIEGLERSFYFKRSDTNWRFAGSVEDTSYLSSEGLSKGKRFTGAMAGIYVHSKGKVYFHNYQIRGEKNGQ